MVRSLDDIDKSLNLFSGRVREWFGLHFPEFDAVVESHETYMKLIMELGARANWSRKKIKQVIKSNEKVEKLSVAAQSSIGADMSDEDLSILQSFCKEMLVLYKIRDEISICVEKVIEEFAPNILSITGPLIAARLVSLAGGIENLAKMPASTVQVLGAEKALFRSLKTKALPPKHGIIFQHAAIHQSPKWQRGKIARVLAAKIAIAARLDAFGGDFQGDALKADVERKILEIKKRSKKPPDKAKKRGKRRKGKKSFKR
jgi:nucleolar protein 56